MSFKNKTTCDGNVCTISVPHNQDGEIVVYHVKVTPDQFKIIEDAGIGVMGMYTYTNGTMVARGRGKVDGKYIQPMLHKLLGFELSDMDNLLDFTAAEKEDPFNIPEPVVEVKKIDKPKKPKDEPKIYDEPIDECSEYPVRGVSWNKRKNKYEAKATHKATKNRQFLGYYEPQHVHVANEAVRDFLAHGMDAHVEIMERYYTLYPKKRR